jgi:hypothetical protein
MQIENIPHELTSYAAWVVWRYKQNAGGSKPQKVPYGRNGKQADVMNAETWLDYAEAVSKFNSGDYDGLGFVLSEADPFTFIDIDASDEDGAAARGDALLSAFGHSYIELSPSGTGHHIIVKASVPGGGVRRGNIEMYDRHRYMTVTGDAIEVGRKIVSAQDLVSQLHSQMSGGEKKVKALVDAESINEPSTIQDNDLWVKCASAKNGAKFTDLFAGSWTEDYSSQSQADFALIDIICYHTKDRSQIKRLFRSSALGQREKAQRDKYLEDMITKAFSDMNVINFSALSDQILSDSVSEAVGVPEIEASIESEHVDFPEGIVGKVAEYILASSHRPVRKIALAGALSFVAAVAGRAYNVSDTGLNLYIMLLAATGRGKEAVSNGIDILMSEVERTIPNVSSYVGPIAASAQGLIRYMSGPKQNSIVQMQGEVGLWLQDLCSPKASEHTKGYHRFLLDAYTKSGEGRTIKPIVYADAQKNTQVLKSPALTIFGDSTQSEFSKALSTSMISSGLLPRFLVIEYNGPRVPTNLKRAHLPPDDLLEDLCGLISQSETLNAVDKAMSVRADDDASRLLYEFDLYCDDKINKNDEAVAQMWNRAHLKALKVSALIAVGCNPYDPEIKKSHALYAIDMIKAEVENMTKKFTSGEVAAADDENVQIVAMRKIIVDFVNSSWDSAKKYLSDKQKCFHDAKVIPYSYIQRRLGNVAAFQRDPKGSSFALHATLRTMCQTGEIAEIDASQAKNQFDSAAKCFAVMDYKIISKGVK